LNVSHDMRDCQEAEYRDSSGFWLRFTKLVASSFDVKIPSPPKLPRRGNDNLEWDIARNQLGEAASLNSVKEFRCRSKSFWDRENAHLKEWIAK